MSRNQKDPEEEYSEIEDFGKRKRRYLWDKYNEVPLLKRLYVQNGNNVNAITNQMKAHGFTKITEPVVRSKLQQTSMKLWRTDIGMIKLILIKLTIIFKEIENIVIILAKNCHIPMRHQTK
jgi:hypothetical protein